MLGDFDTDYTVKKWRRSGLKLLILGYIVLKNGKQKGVCLNTRKIIHIDADCFYAAIEMRDDPSLTNIPFAVGGSPSGRGVLTTCNYPARAFGVRSAMPTAQALRLCPQLKVGPVNMMKYREASKEMRRIFEKFTDLIEPLSLDEAYLDVSQSDLYQGSATHMAQTIRADIREKLGITVSAGVSSNKFIAKVASDWNKPDGLKVVTPEEIDLFSAALPVKLIPGVGKVTAHKLERLGFQTCADLREADRNKLVRRFGSFGATLVERAWGRDDRAVNPARNRKSISVENTYAEDLENGQACFEELSDLLVDLMLRIDKANAKNVVQKAFVKIKFNDFSSTTVEKAGTTARISDYRELLAEGLARKPLPVRLLGIGVRIETAGAEQLELHIPQGL